MPDLSPRADAAATPPWHRRILRLGRRTSQVLITAFSVAASVALVAVFFVAFRGTRDDLASYFVPAVVVPLLVAPLASGWVLRLAVELETANTTVAAQAERLAALFLAAPLGLIELGADGEVRRANAVALALLGGGTWGALFVHEAEREAFLGAVREGRPFTARRWEWRGPAHATRALEASLAPIGASPTAHGAILALADITAREADEAAGARARQVELVGRLAAGLAHDFNNLLTIVRGNVQAVRADDPGATHDDALQAIDEAVAGGARLARRLLAISGRVVHAPDAQPIAPLLAETLALAARLLPRHVALESPVAIPAVTVIVDRDAMQQALLNLLVNARDAVGADGTVRVTVDVRPEAGRRWLVLGVHDDGAGMSPGVLSRALEPFFTTKASHEGTGLGLSLVHETMQRHGGHLRLVSTPGAGTVAELWLPDPVATAAATAPGTGPAAGADALLLVDDEAPVRDVTAGVLRHLGYEVTAVASAAEARAHLARSPVSLVVSDVMMPGESGVDLVRWLRAQGRATPVLLVSGYSAEAVEELLRTDPQVAFLAKPWQAQRLDAGVRSLLRPAPIA